MARMMNASEDLHEQSECTIAPHDSEFEVVWLAGAEALEGSPIRGFRTVQIVGYELNLVERLVLSLESKARDSLARTDKASNSPKLL